MTTAQAAAPNVGDDDKQPTRPGSKYRKRADAAYYWWDAMQPQVRKNGVTPGDRATLARLRRSANPFELAVEPATADLFRKLWPENKGCRHRHCDRCRAGRCTRPHPHAHARRVAGTRHGCPKR